MSLNYIQRNILERLRQAMESGDALSLRDVGGEFGLSANTILYHFRKLEDAGFIVRGADGRVVRVNSPDVNSAIAFLPLLGKARCGPPLTDVVDESTTRMIPVPLRILGRNSRKQLYLVRAIGDSMTPKIDNGDLVIFEGGQPPQSGDMVVARIQEGFTIKMFSQTETEFILKPCNPKYEPFVFEKSQANKTFNIDGIAVGVFKPQQNLQENGGE